MSKQVPECPLCGRLMQPLSQTGDPVHLIGFACPMHDEETTFVRVDRPTATKEHP